MSEHPWCRSPSRDEAVRAAEDNRTGPLPTLEEAIANITHKGDHMGTKSDEQAADYRREASGLRTERVTLEIVTHTKFQNAVDTAECVAFVVGEQLRKDRGESVRVVEEVHFDDLAQVAMERDAAIRERDAAKKHHARECAKCSALADKVISLKARVAELESAPAARDLYDIGHKISPFMTLSSGPNGCILELKFKSHADGGAFHGAMVKFFTAAPAAIGAAVSDGVLALEHMIYVFRDDPRPTVQTRLEKLRRLVEVLRDHPQAASDAAGTEVVLPVCPFTPDSTHAMVWWEAIGKVKRALAAAGVTVKEVGK